MRRILIELTFLTVVLSIFFVLSASYVFNFRWVGPLAILTVPASIAGELYGRRTGKKVSSSFAWQVALASSAIISVVFGLFAAVRAAVFSLSGSFPIGVFLGNSLILFLIFLLMIRLVFGWGVTFGVRKNPQPIDPNIFD